jgi:hypothetical protein
MVMIGIDPHKASHTAVAIDDGEAVVAERLVRATRRQVPELVAWADQLGARERTWAVESAGGLAICWPNSFWRRAKRWWTSRPSWRRGCGCWARVARTRTTPTMSAPWPSPRCGRRRWCRSGSRTTPRCCGCCRVATPSCPGPGTRPPAGFMLWSRTWCRAGSAQKSWCPGPLALLEDVAPTGAAAVRTALSRLDLVDDLDRLESQRRVSKTRISAAVAASGTRSRASSGSVTWSPPA